jgi:tripartite ATP-independent transporter DctM subunit
MPLDLIMIAVLIGSILLGFPVSFTIAGVATLFAILGAITGVMDISLLGALGQRFFGVMTNNVLIAIPLFVFMGVVLEKSHIAEELLETMGQLFGRLRGGLGVSVVLVGALLAASTGIVGATVIAMGLIALPTMLRNGYNPKLASGIVCTSGTLGQIIPPSTLLIILSDVMSNSYQQAQFAQGKFTVETISVGQIFAAALLPGLLLVLIYIVYLLTRAWLVPADAPAVASADKSDIPAAIQILRAIIPPVMLIIAVLGAILGGVATPTEAASVGAVGAFILAGHRLGLPMHFTIIGVMSLAALVVAAGVAPVKLQRSDADIFDYLQGGMYGMLAISGLMVLARSIVRLHRQNILKPSLTSTMTVTAMIFATILAASFFSLVFVGLGGEERIASIIEAMPGGPTGALIFCMLILFVLGFFLDFVEITVIVLPLIVPALIIMGHDPIWLSILIAINLQTSFLTPPFGFSLFYLRGVAPAEISTASIYLGVAPFILLQILGISAIWWFPEVAKVLPELLFSTVKHQ